MKLLLNQFRDMTAILLLFAIATSCMDMIAAEPGSMILRSITFVAWVIAAGFLIPWVGFSIRAIHKGS